MLSKIKLLVLIAAGSLVLSPILAQTSNTFSLPASYHFDREVVQVLYEKKKAMDSSSVHTYFTNSGEFAGMNILGNQTKHKGWVIVNRNGNMAFFNETDKTATIISLRKVFSDISDFTKWIKMDSVMNHMRRKMEGNQMKSVKTGKTKTLAGYTSQEYSVTDSAGRVTRVWCTKVDFPVPIDYILNSPAGKWLPMVNTKLQSHPLLQAMISPGTLVTDIQATDSLGKTFNVLGTSDIRQSPTDFSPAGYSVIDYTNKSLMEIMYAEMRKHMN